MPLPRRRQTPSLAAFSHLIPVPLDPALQPIDPGVLVGRTFGDDTWLFVAPARARLNRDAFSHLDATALRARSDAGIVYADSGRIRGRDLVGLDCKPQLNPSLLLARDYIGLPLLIRGSVFTRLGGLRAEHGPAAWYDLCLRALRAGIGFDRIAATLIGLPQQLAPPDAAAREAVLQRYVHEDGGRFEIRPGLVPGAFQLRRNFDSHPTVTLVIPTRQSGPPGGPPYIVGLLQSIEASSWPLDRIRILIGDDRAEDGIYQQSRTRLDIRRIVTARIAGEPFSYARKMNRLWREAETELLVLLNDDMTIQSPDWLEALFTFALEEDVGGVGARLLFPDRRIQHAGMVGGLYGGCGHPWFGQPVGQPSYGDWADVHRDWCAVTGATFATRRSVLERADGFDERFSLEFNDIDLCLRLKTLGYRIVYTPHAELIHYEKSSRGETPRPGDEVALFLRRWGDFLADDPMYNPQLVRYAEVQPRAESYEAAWMKWA
ncbi:MULTISPECIES: glycosyltransferase family 2 protein [unclassified Inquilinus]|uniref:glycosyltransferase family 2 protein n=1 Tax=unclassified Inquilinus TaxID=2645927 RepID=UPI003F90FD33